MENKSVHLASTHRASDPRVFQKECRTLAEAGYEVVYIVPHEADEIVDGVQIRGVLVPESGAHRYTETLGAIYRRARAEGPSAIFHIHDAELLVVGLRLKRHGHTVIYDAHEDTPRQMLHQHWIPRPLRRPAGWGYSALEALAGRAFDAVVTVVPDIARRYPSEKTILVRNFPRLKELASPDPTPHAKREALTVYVGSITRARGIEEMMRAVDLLPSSLSPTLELGGSFHPPSLADEIETLAGMSRTRVLGHLTRPEVAKVLARARVGLVTLHPTPMYAIAYPTKLFEYMAAGLPVVASNFPLWTSIVEDAGCGLTVDPLDAEAISEAVRWLLEHPSEAEAMGRRGREAVEAKYHWEGEGQRLVALYHRLTHAH